MMPIQSGRPHAPIKKSLQLSKDFSRDGWTNFEPIY